jgi:hypothetical protein
MTGSKSNKRPPGAISQRRMLKIIHAAIQLIEKRIAAKDISVSVRDMIPLMELDAEMAARDPNRKVMVFWKDVDHLPGRAHQTDQFNTDPLNEDEGEEIPFAEEP